MKPQPGRILSVQYACGHTWWYTAGLANLIEQWERQIADEEWTEPYACPLCHGGDDEAQP